MTRLATHGAVLNIQVMGRRERLRFNVYRFVGQLQAGVHRDAFNTPSRTDLHHHRRPRLGQKSNHRVGDRGHDGHRNHRPERGPDAKTLENSSQARVGTS